MSHDSERFISPPRFIPVMVKYIGPTNHRGTRFSVRVASGYRNQAKSKLYSYDYSLTLADNIQSVALKHAKASGMCAINFVQAVMVDAQTSCVLLKP
jgi:hypothetical protein